MSSADSANKRLEAKLDLGDVQRLGHGAEQDHMVVGDLARFAHNGTFKGPPQRRRGMQLSSSPIPATPPCSIV
jgi:hypothetical protein